MRVLQHNDKTRVECLIGDAASIRRRVPETALRRVDAFGEHVRPNRADEDVFDGHPRKQNGRIRNEASVTAPPERFGAQDGGACRRRFMDEFIESRAERGGFHVVRIPAKGRISQTCVLGFGVHAASPTEVERAAVRDSRN